MGIDFNEHGKVPIADGAIHDYGLPQLGHTSATVERYGLRYAPVSTNTSTSTKYKHKRPKSCPGLALGPLGPPSGTLARLDRDMELAALAHTKNGWR